MLRAREAFGTSDWFGCGRIVPTLTRTKIMRAEVQQDIEAIKQSIELLRRHL